MEKLEQIKIPSQIMSFEDYANFEHAQPYIYSLEKDDKKLTYFGARHSHNPNDPMFDEIEENFNTAQPKLVIVEGINNLEENKDRVIEYLSKETPEQAIERGGESRFALKLAAEKGIDMQCPEPKMNKEIKFLETQSFSREAIFAFYLYRTMNQYWRLDKEKRPSIEEYLKPYLDEFKNDAGWEDFEFSAEHLELIGREIWGDKGLLDNPKFAADRIDPVPWPEKQTEQTMINQVARASSQYRDEYIVEKIKEALKQKGNVFVVYGASHAVMQEPAMRAIFEHN